MLHSLCRPRPPKVHSSPLRKQILVDHQSPRIPRNRTKPPKQQNLERIPRRQNRQHHGPKEEIDKIDPTCADKVDGELFPFFAVGLGSELDGCDGGVEEGEEGGQGADGSVGKEEV